ncbi:hypothetical protein HPB50_027378 [Hyalomma asiaticum]|uniref:Uncharacterized protein n=1 Tax=Hyalomma asiaticum TaxID=266040 RepID=A0ACB7TQA9_HYAAI|nr:hypothetical protein HPB50_027378 [Hyalomma asiaticum]
MSRVGDAGDGEGAGSETTVTEETGSQSEINLLKMKIRLRELELEIAEVPVWFEAAESALDAYEVPKEWWGQIIFPLVAEKISFLSTRLAPHQLRLYEALKGAVLEELKLSAGEYLRRLRGARKRATEGWRAFATRLQSYLRLYVETRGVGTFEQLLELLTADQLKESLSEAALRYVTLQEAGDWRRAPELASLLLTFGDAEGKNSGCKLNGSKTAEASSERFQKQDSTKAGG